MTSTECEPSEHKLLSLSSVLPGLRWPHHRFLQARAGAHHEEQRVRRLEFFVIYGNSDRIYCIRPAELLVEQPWWPILDLILCTALEIETRRRADEQSVSGFTPLPEESTTLNVGSYRLRIAALLLVLLPLVVECYSRTQPRLHQIGDLRHSLVPMLPVRHSEYYSEIPDRSTEISGNQGLSKTLRSRWAEQRVVADGRTGLSPVAIQPPPVRKRPTKFNSTTSQI